MYMISRISIIYQYKLHTCTQCSVSKALYGLNVSVRYFKVGEAVKLQEAINSEGGSLILVFTEQAILECQTAALSAVSVLYYFLPPNAGAQMLSKYA